MLVNFLIMVIEIVVIKTIGIKMVVIEIVVIDFYNVIKILVVEFSTSLRL